MESDVTKISGGERTADYICQFFFNVSLTTSTRKRISIAFFTIAIINESDIICKNKAKASNSKIGDCKAKHAIRLNDRNYH